jgi:hypothetical protein
MDQTLRQDTPTQIAEAAVSGISWAAAGAVASLALTMLLLSFGAGVDLP